MKLILQTIKKLNFKSFKTWLIIVYSSWGIFFIYLWTKVIFYSQHGISTISEKVWGDWAFHFAGSYHFAELPIVSWLETNPIFSQSRYVYPFLINLISGILIKFNFDQVYSFLIPSIVFSLIFLLILIIFYYKLLKSGALSFVGLTIFLFSGGLGFMYWLINIINQSNRSVNYTDLPEKGIYLQNFIISQLLPQRSFLLGLIFTLVTIYFINKWNRNYFKNLKSYKLFLLGILSGCLLIIHIHSYLVLILICFVFLILNYKLWQKYLIFALGAFISSFLIIFLLFQNLPNNGFFQFSPGWLASIQNINIIYFWLINWGFFIIIALISTFKLKLGKNPFVLSGWLIFFISNLFVFQPWDWDNTKLFTWAYLLLVIPVVLFLSFLWQKNIIYKICSVLLFIFIIFSGCLDVLNLMKPNKPVNSLITYQDIEKAEKFISIAKADEIVLISTKKHNHWIITQTGNSVLMGYEGWVWSHGFDYQTIYHDIQQIYQGSSKSAYLLEKYNISYVVIGPAELAEYDLNYQFFQDNYEIVLDFDDTKVFVIK